MSQLLSRVFGTLSLSSLLLCSFFVSLSCRGVRSDGTTQVQSSSASRQEASPKQSGKASTLQLTSSHPPSTTLSGQPLLSSSPVQPPPSLAEAQKRLDDERTKLGMKLTSEPAERQVPLPSKSDSPPDSKYESMLLVLCTFLTALVCLVSLQICFRDCRR